MMDTDVLMGKVIPWFLFGAVMLKTFVTGFFHGRNKRPITQFPAAIWRSVSPLLFMFNGLWLLSLGFLLYPVTTRWTDAMLAGDMTSAFWIGTMPLYILLLFIAAAVVSMYSGIKRIKQIDKKEDIVED